MNPVLVPWLTVLVPLAVAVLVAASGRVLGKAAPWLTLLAPLTVLAVGVDLALDPAMRAAGGSSVPWLGIPGLAVTASMTGLNTLMLVVVGVVASCVVLFSIGYMSHDPNKPRYFALLAAFCAAMCLLLLAGDLVTLLAGWELVGTCSYLLIGFWYKKPSAANAAIKAFLVTHVGDAGMLLGIALLWTSTHHLALSSLEEAAKTMPPGTLTIVALLLLLGAVGKSAQFPLHFWLPDAMEGPTPVSALIHAATMVAAGVYLVARLEPLFAASATASGVVLAIGAFTALMAATIAVAQSDIKKVLAYSTISQLGFMFAALGAGAWEAAIFHLVTHAAFKALLFLGSGSVIHATETQELAEMGGLAKKMPVTATTWIAGAVALAGIPPLAGFFSKDAVVANVLHASWIAGVALLAASLLTAFYITRATMLAFFGEYRGVAHPHEGGLVMTFPLVVLGLGAVGLGFAGDAVFALLGGRSEGIEWPVAAIAIGLACVGAGAALALYRRGTAGDETLQNVLGRSLKVLRAGYGYDAAVLRGVVAPFLAFARGSYEFADRKVVDGAAEGVGSAARGLGRWLALLQGGDVQWYGLVMGAGALVLLAVAFVVGR